MKKSTAQRRVCTVCGAAVMGRIQKDGTERLMHSNGGRAFGTDHAPKPVQA